MTQTQSFIATAINKMLIEVSETAVNVETPGVNKEHE